MQIKIVKVGYLETNCYIIENDKETLIIDPGDESEKIIPNITKKVVGILITHHHFDHVGAADEQQAKYNCKVYDYQNLKEGQNKIGAFAFEMIRTPGHKDDLISLLFNKDLFCGDFIFKGTIGRYDLDGSNFKDMQNSIHKILKYDKDITIYPGHGNSTTLKEEEKQLKNYV